MKRKFEKYITCCIIEACFERCSDATMEEESPQLSTMTLKKFMEMIKKK